MLLAHAGSTAVLVTSEVRGIASRLTVSDNNDYNARIMLVYFFFCMNRIIQEMDMLNLLITYLKIIF